MMRMRYLYYTVCVCVCVKAEGAGTVPLSLLLHASRAQALMLLHSQCDNIQVPSLLESGGKYKQSQQVLVYSIMIWCCCRFLGQCAARALKVARLKLKARAL